MAIAEEQTEEYNKLLKENYDMKIWMKQYQETQEAAKKTVSAHLYEHQLTQDLLKNQITHLKERIEQLTVELNAYTSTHEDQTDMEWDETSKEIKGASVDKLIDCLYYDHGSKMTMEYVKVFLLTYHAFTTPREILEHLIKRYAVFSADNASMETFKAERIRIGNFLRKWITENYFDFNDKELQAKYEQFNQIISKRDSKLAQNIHATFTRKKAMKRATTTLTFSISAPNPIPPRLPISSILDIPSLEFARQMTINDFEFCRLIEPKECLGMAWTKKDKDQRSPNLLAMIKRFNEMGRWLAYVIVAEPNLRTRSRLLTHIVEILQNLVELNNFNGVFQIVAGLGNSAVFRLNKTFAELKPDKKRAFEDIQFLTNPNKSWQNYRQKIHTINPPCVPFIGVYQTDLTFIEEGNKDKLPSGLINFKKCRLIANVITEIQQYQTQPYNLTIVPTIYSYISKCLAEFGTFDEKKMFELSLIAEPREG